MAPPSSLPFQERYVIGGKTDQYVLDTELLENVDGLGPLLENPANGHVLDDMQSAKLAELVECVRENSGAALSAGSRDSAAIHIRRSGARAAAGKLSDTSFSLSSSDAQNAFNHGKAKRLNGVCDSDKEGKIDRYADVYQPGQWILTAD